MNTDFAIVTSVTRNYLHLARALALSVHEAHPEAPVFACVADRTEAPLQPASEPCQIVYADELGIPNWPRFSFQYTGKELAAALKPFAIERVLLSGDFAGVIYFDADIQVYNSLNHLIRSCEDCCIVLTPHVCSPLPTDGIWDEQAFLRAGVYNSGFLALKRSATALEMLRWWKAKLSRRCIHDQADGLRCWDQGWLDLVPGLFDGVRIERGAGYNVAYWNLSDRRVRRSEDGKVLANEDPLVFFHFSGFDPSKPDKLSIYTDRAWLPELPVLNELAAAYVRRLNECGRETCTRWGYGFDRLKDGTPIQPLWREAIRTDDPSLASVENPFDNSALPDLKDRFRAAEARASLSRLCWRFQALEEKVAELERRSRRLSQVQNSRVLGPIVRWWARVRKWNWDEPRKDIR